MRVAPTTTDPIEIYVVPLAMMFPEGIEAIPNDVGPAGLSLEIKGQRLCIQVLTDGLDARLFVIGSSGWRCQLHLT